MQTYLKSNKTEGVKEKEVNKLWEMLGKEVVFQME